MLRLFVFIFTLFILFNSILLQTSAQTKILYTSLDYNTGDLRACIMDTDGTNKTDLGFNKTYLPFWVGNNIVFNSDTFIWKVDLNGENMREIATGYRVAESNNKDKFAFYNEGGIGIADINGTLLKQIYVDCWEDVSITWSKNDEHITYYKFETEKCYMFDIANETISLFGDYVYHPLWHNNHNMILFNKMMINELYGVYLRKGEEDFLVSNPAGMSVVPIWSNDGTKIAYFEIIEFVDYEVESDMYISQLILYDVIKGESSVLANDAGFTDKAFPQFSFDDSDEHIYYTAINDKGYGSIVKISLETKMKTVISNNPDVDERFPLIRTLSK